MKLEFCLNPGKLILIAFVMAFDHITASTYLKEK